MINPDTVRLVKKDEEIARLRASINSTKKKLAKARKGCGVVLKDDSWHDYPDSHCLLVVGT